MQAVLDEYAACYDGRRPEGFANAFVPDGVLELPDHTVIAGHEALAAFASDAARRRPNIHHFSANLRVRITGDVARSTAHVTAVSNVGDDVRLLLIGRYDDTLAHTPDGWRITRRRIIALTADDLRSD